MRTALLLGVRLLGAPDRATSATLGAPLSAPTPSPAQPPSPAPTALPARPA